VQAVIQDLGLIVSENAIRPQVTVEQEYNAREDKEKQC
jgi:hypothetical protein